MAKIGTNTGAAIELWNPRTKAWIVEDVDHTMNIKGVPELLIRFLGVTNCHGFRRIIGEDDTAQDTHLGKRRLENNSDGGQIDSPSYSRGRTPIWLSSLLSNITADVLTPLLIPTLTNLLRFQLFIRHGAVWFFCGYA